MVLCGGSVTGRKRSLSGKAPTGNSGFVSVGVNVLKRAHGRDLVSR